LPAQQATWRCPHQCQLASRNRGLQQRHPGPL